MTIAKLASEGGVGIETVRFYQRRGLMSEPKRPASAGRNGGIRRYSADDLRRLRFIKSAQAAGFTLQEVGELLVLDAVDDRVQVRRIAQERIAALDVKIAELMAARNALRSLARRCARGGPGPCPILSAFEQPDRASRRS
jgi:MerR family transcriptional regulator, mercuric resistance operon regulatory protein